MRNKITFFTTTIYTDIQEVQSACIKKYFPDSKQILIDGRSGWFTIWYEWLNKAKDIDSDYFIHIDEDCFITSNNEILKLIEEMKAGDYDIAGPPDGYHHYRGGNYMAMNSFFMIVSKKAVETWHNRTHIPQFNPEWIEEYPFEKVGGFRFVYNMEFGSSGKPTNQIWQEGTEPYYDFFWVLKEAGIKFKYLEPLYEEKLQTTNLLNNDIIHMWWTRQRSSNQIGPGMKMPNKVRYDIMKELILKHLYEEE